METQAKDCRNTRFARLNFKKRDNQREQNARLKHSSQKIDQSFTALFGDRFGQRVWDLTTLEKLDLIKKERAIPKKIRKLHREYYPIAPAEPINIPAQA